MIVRRSLAETRHLAAPINVDEYLAALPEERRAVAEELRRAIRAAAPEARETIAYQMPAYRCDDGRLLVSFALFKSHASLFPASEAVVEALGVELKPYLRGKATITFAADREVPVALVTKVVAVRVAENLARGPRRSRRPPGTSGK